MTSALLQLVTGNGGEEGGVTPQVAIFFRT
jgi:hypothetical protein